MAALLLAGFALLFVLTLLDLFLKNKLIHLLAVGSFLALVPHNVLWSYLFIKSQHPSPISSALSVLFIAFLYLFTIVIWLKMNIVPVPLKEKTTMRLKIIMGGRSICYYAIYSSVVQSAFYLIGSWFLLKQHVLVVFVADLIVTLCTVFFLYLNGVLRIFFGSKRLRLVPRAILLLTVWIPVINIVVILYCCYIIKMEYDHECYRIELDKIRVESGICATKYPLLMLHGVGFHDLKYFNYWGRIPKTLIRNGAAIHYGNQESWGTVKDNGEDIKNRISDVLKETGAEKVNIIAHSKGGLDARYVISSLGMADYVASLTTMSTPHHGSRAIDFLLNLIPDGLYRFVAKRFDKHCTNYGDKHPDFYTASRQFSTHYSEEFNAQTPDAPGVYYQSFASVMNSSFSDSLLSVPFFLVKSKEGPNDGLVCVDSAKWGNFRGVFSCRPRRGISHADMIDLKREDYKGFDVIEEYVKIVAELRQMGY